LGKRQGVRIAVLGQEHDHHHKHRRAHVFQVTQKSGTPGLMLKNETAARTGVACTDWLGIRIMNSIILSFLCGAAFIGGAVAMTVLVIMVKSAASKKNREEIHAYWRNSLEKHATQLAILERIAAVMEKRKDA
jgi:hypothetical protein